MNLLVRAAVALSVFAAIGLLLVRADASPTLNPHGNTERCAACHDPIKPDQSIHFTQGSADKACRSCHDEDPHQVGLEPKRTKVPAQMLLNDGKLACYTCHDEPACDGNPISKDNTHFFRAGPYTSTGALCAQCHKVTGKERLNPHRHMVDGDRAQICTLCHTKTPGPDVPSELRVSGPNICLGCHTERPHAGAVQHDTVLSNDLRQRAERAELPLAGARMVCLTCHDPHPHGLISSSGPAIEVGSPAIPADWMDKVLSPALARRQSALGSPLQANTTEPNFLRMRLAKGELCSTCHTPKQIDAQRRRR